MDRGALDAHRQPGQVAGVVGDQPVEAVADVAAPVEIAKVRPSIRVSVPVPARIAGSCRLPTSSARRAWSPDRKAKLRARLRHAGQRDEREGGLGGRPRPGGAGGRGRALAVPTPVWSARPREPLVARRHRLGGEPLRHPAPAGAPVDLVDARARRRPAPRGSRARSRCTRPPPPRPPSPGRSPAPASRTPWPRSSPSRRARARRSGRAAPARRPAGRTSRGVELAQPDDVRAERRLDVTGEVLLLGGLAALGADQQRQPRRLRDADGVGRALLGRHPAEEGEVAVRLRPERDGVRSRPLWRTPAKGSEGAIVRWASLIATRRRRGEWRAMPS